MRRSRAPPGRDSYIHSGSRARGRLDITDRSARPGASAHEAHDQRTPNHRHGARAVIGRNRGWLRTSGQVPDRPGARSTRCPINQVPDQPGARSTRRPINQAPDQPGAPDRQRRMSDSDGHPRVRWLTRALVHDRCLTDRRLDWRLRDPIGGATFRWNVPRPFEVGHCQQTSICASGTVSAGAMIDNHHRLVSPAPLAPPPRGISLRDDVRGKNAITLQHGQIRR
jgi:hypothetical protein